MYRRYIKNTKTLEYRYWSDMVSRCNSQTKKLRFKNYLKDCELCPEWQDYQTFAKWANEQVGFKKGFELDKDLIKPNNKIYSPEFCCFIPKRINLALVLRLKNKGSLKLGVYYSKSNKGFVAQCGLDGQRYLGTFKTEDEAHLAYKETKEAYIRKLAEDFKDEISEVAYTSLLKYNIYDYTEG